MTAPVTPLTRPRRAGDRWMTPAVACTVIVCGSGVTVYVTDRVADLAAAGVDPAPVLQFVAQVITAVTAAGTLVLQLVGRAQSSRTEQNTDRVAKVLAKVQEQSGGS